jgi:drug/metabolite transporter (DMT)-like permease
MSRPDHPYRAAAWMGGAIVAFTALSAAARQLLEHLSTIELLAWRSVIGLALLSLVLAGQGRLPSALRTAQPWRHLGRNLVHFAGQNLWFFAITVISLAEVVALEFTTALWVALLAPLVLGERMTPARAAAALLGFAGVLIVVRPGFAPFSAGHWAALIAAFSYAVVALFTRNITRTDRPETLLFWMLASQSVMALGIAFSQRGLPVPQGGDIWLTLIVATTGLIAPFCLTSAFANAPAIIVQPMDFLRLPLTALAGFAFFGQPFSAWVFIGGALIVGANLLNLRPSREAPPVP